MQMTMRLLMLRSVCVASFAVAFGASAQQPAAPNPMIKKGTMQKVAAHSYVDPRRQRGVRAERRHRRRRQGHTDRRHGTRKRERCNRAARSAHMFPTIPSSI